jgi:acyl carrier protein
MTVSSGDKTAQISAAVTDELGKVLRGLPAGFTAQTPLMSSGLLNSFAALELVQGLEARLGVSFKDEDLSQENFETAEMLTRLLARY